MDDYEEEGNLVGKDGVRRYFVFGFCMCICVFVFVYLCTFILYLCHLVGEDGVAVRR